VHRPTASTNAPELKRARSSVDERPVSDAQAGMVVTEATTGVDGRVELINTTDVPVSRAMVADALQATQPLIASMMRWSDETRSPASRKGNLIDRDRYVSPAGYYGKVRTARLAMKDDVVSGVADTTEGLALKRMSFFSRDRDEQDIWNQWAALVNLDARMREAYRVLYSDSSFVMAAWWGIRDFKVRGTTDQGNERRKSYAGLQVPLALTLIDTLKVAPVGSFMFGQERLAYVADKYEADVFDRILARRDGVALPGNPFGGNVLSRPYYSPAGTGSEAPPLVEDPIVERLILARYVPDQLEAQRLREQGVDPTWLYLLDPRSVFRHSHTRPSFQPFPDVRMESVFELLDIKQQLHQMDRAHLIGGTNFIVLVKIGTDKDPGLPEEVAHLTANARTIAQVPLIVGDHRLNVEIVTPKLDTTLNRDRYDVVDVRLVARLYRMFVPTGAGQDQTDKLGKIIGSSLNSQRHMILRSFEANLFGPIVDRNERLRGAKLRFHPSKISLDFDAAYASFLMDLRSTGDVSRETALGEFELDQDYEALLREREAQQYDEIFLTQAPYGTPNPATQRVTDPNAGDGRAAQRRAGRQGGGIRNGGGAAPGSGQGQEPRRAKRPSRASLMDEARRLGIRGRTAMNRDELLEAIEAAEEDA
jgi:hypothetical protein